MPLINLTDEQVGIIRGALATHGPSPVLGRVSQALTTETVDITPVAENIIKVPAGTMVWVEGLGSVCMFVPDGERKVQVSVNTDDMSPQFRYDIDEARKGTGGYPMIAVNVNDYDAYDDNGPYDPGVAVEEYVVTETRTFTVLLPSDADRSEVPLLVREAIVEASPTGDTYRARFHGSPDRHIERDGEVIA